jgi:glycosyltransferase involved in cell wall biosynthesis
LRDDEFSIDRRADELGVDYIEIQERHSYDPAIWTKLRKLVRDRRPHIVHGHEYKTNVLAWLLAKVEPVIPLSTVHGWFGRDTWRERLYYGIDRRVLARFERLIAVSGPLADQLVAAGCRRDRVTVVPNGIDHKLFVRVPGRREEVRRSLGIAGDDIIIGAVGRLEAQKRFDVLMEAVALVRRHRPRARLFVAGAGGLQEELAAVHHRLALGDACVMLGHRTDIAALHHAFDVFVQASDREGSPNVVLEAMALGTPIIATDVGGTGDLITDGVHGLIVPSGSRDALANAIDRVLDDWPATEARAVAARRRIEDEFSFDRRMDRVEAIYEQLVSSRRI